MADDDAVEAIELEQVAEWRLRLVDAQPGDTASAAAAVQLQQLALEVRGLAGSKLLEEYRCICNWLSESDGISELAMLAHQYRTRIGFDRSPQSGEEYLRALLRLAQQTMGG